MAALGDGTADGGLVAIVLEPAAVWDERPDAPMVAGAIAGRAGARRARATGDRPRPRRPAGGGGGALASSARAPADRRRRSALARAARRACSDSRSCSTGQDGDRPTGGPQDHLENILTAGV